MPQLRRCEGLRAEVIPLIRALPLKLDSARARLGQTTEVITILANTAPAGRLLAERSGISPAVASGPSEWAGTIKHIMCA